MLSTAATWNLSYGRFVAIYTLLEDQIIEDLEWWKDKVIMQDFDKRYDDYKSSSKTYSLEEVEASIEELKQMRAAKLLTT